MKIKAQILKPYTDKQRIDFIVENNHQQGYEIRETEIALEAWGYTTEEQEQKKREQIAKLSLTKREVFLALYRAKGITPEMVRGSIQDEEALIEFDYATEYYRFNPLIDIIGAQLGYTSDDLDYLFEHKELPQKEQTENYSHIGENEPEMEVTTNNDEYVNIEDINESTTDTTEQA